MPVFPFRKGEKFVNQLNSEEFLTQILKCKQREPFSKTKIRVQVDQMFQNMLCKYYDDIGFERYIKKSKIEYLPYECNSTMQIDAQGEAVPGPEWDKDKSAGNVYNKSLKEIWNEGKNWEQFRAGRSLKDTKCEHCKIYNICAGGSLKLAYDKYHTINNPDGSCLLGESYE